MCCHLLSSYQRKVTNGLTAAAAPADDMTQTSGGGDGGDETAVQ